MNDLMSSRPLRGSWSEYLSSMSGAAISSTTPRLHFSPQNSVNHLPTIALLSSSFLLMRASFHRSTKRAMETGEEEDRNAPRAFPAVLGDSARSRIARVRADEERDADRTRAR